MKQTARFLEDAALDELRTKIVNHDIYSVLGETRNLQQFMQYHVFAVWDFMCLLKRLQQEVAGVSVPWLPPADIQAARLINEIVLGEETDQGPDGSFASHYQLYLDAMLEIGADVRWIRAFTSRLDSGMTVGQSLQRAEVPHVVCRFVTGTFEMIEGGKPHVLAAALFYGREELIPEMFQPMIETLHGTGVSCGKFIYYLKRHIELDAGEHAVWAEELLCRLCNDHSEHVQEAREAAVRVLGARLRLWDGVLESIRREESGSPPA